MKPTIEDLERIQREAFKSLPPSWISQVATIKDAVYYRFLEKFSTYFRPNLSVELGTLSGASACAIARGNPKGKVVTIDLDTRFINDYFYMPNIEFRNKDSLTVDSYLADIDLIFIDTIHNGKKPEAEYLAWKNNLSKDGIVFFDDIWINPMMEEFWERLAGKKYELLIHDHYGFGVLLEP